MRLMRPRVFWACVLGVLVVICIPSVVLLETIQNYRHLLQSMEAPVLRPSLSSSIFHRGAKLLEEDSLPQFVEFRLSAPEAKSVFITGDFAQWRMNAYALKRRGKGRWEIVLPLLPGRYHYLFVVDGTPRLDSANPASDAAAGRWTSVKIVGP